MRATIRPRSVALAAAGVFLLLTAAILSPPRLLQPSFAASEEALRHRGRRTPTFDAAILQNTSSMLEDGRRIFRFDAFGSEAFWGDQLRLHDAIQGAKFGGVGAGVSPEAALALGLKVDAEALPPSMLNRMRRGRLNLDDPAVTLELLRRNAVVGVTGLFDGNRLRSMGIQCSLCHSTVDDSVAPGIGRRLDGWANRDLNVGAIVASAPDLSPFATLLGVSQETVRTVLNSWGPGKFDAELVLEVRRSGRTGSPLPP
jgi:hypothetical protein